MFREMDRRYFLIAGALVLGGLGVFYYSFFGERANRPPGSSAPGGLVLSKTYRNESLRFEVKHPENWTVKEVTTDYANGPVGLRVALRDGSSSPALEIEVFSKSEDDDSAEEAYERMFPISTGTNELETTLFVSGTNAHYYRNKPNVQPRGSVVFDDMGKLYNIRQFTDDETFYSIVSSFRLTSGQTEYAIQRGDFIYCSLDELRDLSRKIDALADKGALLEEKDFRRLVDCLLVYRERTSLTDTRLIDINNDGRNEIVVSGVEKEGRTEVFMILHKTPYGGYYTPLPPFLATSVRYDAPRWLRSARDQILDVDGDGIYEIVRDGSEVFVFQNSRFASSAGSEPIPSVSQAGDQRAWTKAGFPVEYYRSFEMWYPSDWMLQCCQESAAANYHFVFSDPVAKSSGPYIKVYDFFIVECLKDDVSCATTPDRYFEVLRRSLDEEGELLFMKNESGFEKVGIATRAQFVGSTFVYRRTETPDGKPDELYISHTGTGVIGVLFHDYDGIGRNVIIEFLNRLQPK